MGRMQIPCDCGCGKEVFNNQLVEVKIEQAIDRSLRKTVTSKRFWVTRECKEPFEQELAMKLLLQQLVEAWTPPARTRYYLINFWLNPARPPLVLRNWIRRMIAARKVMRLQHEIHERLHGFEYAKVRATNSSILFGAPRFMQGFLARRFTHRLQKAMERSKSEKNAHIAQDMSPVVQ
jgi:hypothetical protein